MTGVSATPSPDGKNVHLTHHKPGGGKMIAVLSPASAYDISQKLALAAFQADPTLVSGALRKLSLAVLDMEDDLIAALRDDPT